MVYRPSGTSWPGNRTLVGSSTAVDAGALMVPPYTVSQGTLSGSLTSGLYFRIHCDKSAVGVEYPIFANNTDVNARAVRLPLREAEPHIDKSARAA
jgi:hypothetical protein